MKVWKLPNSSCSSLGSVIESSSSKAALPGSISIRFFKSVNESLDRDDSSDKGQYLAIPRVFPNSKLKFGHCQTLRDLPSDQ